MNNIMDPGYNDCTSCGICAVVCPNKSISINLDQDGFYRPIVDNSKCSHCGICKEVCYKFIESPIEFYNYFKDKDIFAAWSKDENLLSTVSSGGIGHEICRYGIQNGYEICGVIYDKKENICKHTIVSDENDLNEIKTSKYLQSYTYDALIKLDSKKKYIIVGTPCQIYGIRQLIRLKQCENNFILVDFFCHGTPSYLLWGKYLSFVRKNYSIQEISKINFRNKREGWHKYSMFIQDNRQKTYKNNLYDDLFFKFYLKNTCLNKSCYKCLFRLDKCYSDIRMGDFWGKKYSDNSQGVSLVSINTENGDKVWNGIKHLFHYEKNTFENLKQSQPVRYLKKNTKSEEVMKLLKSEKSLDDIYKKTIIIHFLNSLIAKSKNALSKIARKLS